MTRRNRFLLMAGVLLLILLVLGCANSSQAAGKVEEVQTPSGLNAWLIRDTNLPIITLQVSVEKAGGAYDPEGKEGLAYLTAAMLMEGAGSYEAEAFQRELDYYAINISVSADRDSYTITMETLSQHREKAFALMGLMLNKPRFDAPDIDRIKAEHLADLKRAAEKPGFQLGKAFQETAFAGHAYARPLLGTPGSIHSITRQDMQQFAASHLAKNRLIISAVGDIAPDELGRLLEKALSALPAQASVKADLQQANLQHPAKPVHIDMPLPQTSVRVALPGIRREDKRFFAAYVLNHILGGGSLTSLLGTEIREKRGLTYSIGSDLVATDYAQWLSIDFATENRNRDEAVSLVMENLRKVAAEGVSPQQVTEAKNYLTGAFPLNTDSNAERVGYLMSMQRYHLGKDYLEKRNALIQEVTEAQIRDMAKALLRTDHVIIVTAGGTHP